MAKPSDEQIAAALKNNGGNKMAAARELDCNRWVVWNYCKRTRQEEDNQSLRDLRNAEAKLRRAKDELKQEKERREIAEQDLRDLLERDDIIRDVSEHEILARTIANYQDDRSTEGGCTAIVCANDWHLEKKIQPSTVSGLNEFNLSIAERRVDRLWGKAVYLIEFWRNIAEVDEVILWLGGDLMNNYLHDEDVESNFCGPTEAILAIQDHVATGIEHLKDNVGLDRVVTNYGNHGRSTRYNRPATGWKTSWEYLAYKNLERTYGKLDWNITQGYMNYLDIQGYKARFHHGENVKYYGGVGGLTIPMNKAVQQWDKSRRADLSISGHFHQYLDYWSWVSCGCLCGYDAYAQSIKAEFQEPTQTIVFVDKTRGKVQSIPIFVERPHQEYV